MLTTKKETKELTEQKENFITALFGEANGRPAVYVKAVKRVGKDHTADIKALKEEIASLKSNSKASKRSEEHTSELQSHSDLVCRILLEQKK